MKRIGQNEGTTMLPYYVSDKALYLIYKDFPQIQIRNETILTVGLLVGQQLMGNVDARGK